MNWTTVLTLAPEAGNPRNSEGAFLRLGNGSILFAYSRFEGDSHQWGDDDGSDIAARYSFDEGRTWSERDRILIPHGEAQCVMSVSLLRLAPNRIMMLFLKKNNKPVSCTPYVTFSEDEGETWATPVCISGIGGYHVVNNDRVVQLKSGRIIVPVAWHRPMADGHDSRSIGLVLLSDDEGKTFREAADWILPPQSNYNGLQEPGVLELEPGKLLIFFRTDLGCQVFARSEDDGEHWSKVEKSNFISPLSPMTMKRDPFDSRIWTLWNDRSGRWNLPAPVAAVRGRTPLVLGRGENLDHLETMLLEQDPACGYCYCALHFEQNYVLLAYCCGGKDCHLLQKSKIVRLER